MQTKTYQVSLVISNIKASNKANAINEFDNLVKESCFKSDSYEVELETELKENIIEYTGAKPTCTTCGKKDGIIRLPHLKDRLEASKMVYIACNKCFSATWAGEN